MPTHVYANNNEVASKAADGKSIAAFPDVCFSPPAPPVGPIPLPYPNTGEVKDTDSGTAKVFVKDKMSGMAGDSHMTKSMGDEPATKNFNKGLITGALQGKCYFGLWSMDVNMEGKGVPRHLDMVTHNHGSMPAQCTRVATIKSIVAKGKIEAIDVKKLCAWEKTPTPEQCKYDVVPGCEFYDLKYKLFIMQHPGKKPPSYYKDYGGYYCKKFTCETYNKLSESCKKWLIDARCNLQFAIQKIVDQDPLIELNEAKFKSAAFQSHADSYWEAGLNERCNNIKDMASIGLTVDLKEYFDIETWKQMFDIAGRKINAFMKNPKLIFDFIRSSF